MTFWLILLTLIISDNIVVMRWIGKLITLGVAECKCGRRRPLSRSSEGNYTAGDPITNSSAAKGGGGNSKISDIFFSLLINRL